MSSRKSSKVRRVHSPVISLNPRSGPVGIDSKSPQGKDAFLDSIYSCNSDRRSTITSGERQSAFHGRRSPQLPAPDGVIRRRSVAKLKGALVGPRRDVIPSRIKAHLESMIKHLAGVVDELGSLKKRIGDEPVADNGIEDQPLVTNAIVLNGGARSQCVMFPLNMGRMGHATTKGEKDSVAKNVGKVVVGDTKTVVVQDSRVGMDIVLGAQKPVDMEPYCVIGLFEFNGVAAVGLGILDE